MRFLTGLAFLLLGPLLGCATVPAIRDFQATTERLRAAVLKVLAHCPDVEESGEVIRTGQCDKPIAPELRQSPQGWKERHEVRIKGTTIEVRSRVETTGLYGHGRHNWETRDPSRVEQAVLDAIEKELKENP